MSLTPLFGLCGAPAFAVTSLQCCSTWPTIVCEVAFSSSYSELISTASKWCRESAGKVRVVLCLHYRHADPTVGSACTIEVQREQWRNPAMGVVESVGHFTDLRNPVEIQKEVGDSIGRMRGRQMWSSYPSTPRIDVIGGDGGEAKGKLMLQWGDVFEPGCGRDGEVVELDLEVLARTVRDQV
ncbi:hypothetical protein EX30DRAFT_351464 [Ascodesmis nigricans]|uniref:Uncharacterized protein n=1 Tax=Ascodesmis nigricans TaxID=341454 RepID=A0A4S2MLP2_9PEZI|nr:hypothetical protein EX30DRAFT_351464 [Ascodesmis nigricans]